MNATFQRAFGLRAVGHVLRRAVEGIGRWQHHGRGLCFMEHTIGTSIAMVNGPMKRFGIFAENGLMQAPARKEWRGRSYYFMAPQPTHQNWHYILVVAEGPSGIEPVVVIRLQLEAGKVVDIWVLNGTVVDHYSPRGRLVESSRDVPALRARARRLRLAGATICARANVKLEPPVAVAKLTAVWKMVLERRQDRINALVAAGVIRAKLNWDREERGWRDGEYLGSLWGIVLLSEPGAVRLLASCTRNPRDVTGETMTLRTSVYLGKHGPSVSILTAGTSVRVLSGKEAAPVLLELTNRNDLRRLIEIVLQALEDLLDFAETKLPLTT